MNVTFVNGTEAQHEAVHDAFRSLLHLDLDRFAFDLSIEFVPNPDPTIHNEFADATGETTPALIQIRTDFPNFAPTALWGSSEFARETVIHELAHVLIGKLSTSVLIPLLNLFGVTIEQYNDDPNHEWEDRIREGMAETFKDAFLPNRLRAYFNRTNVKLPISKYPAFRQIFREGLAGGGRFCYVYGSDSFRVTDEWGIGLPLHQSDDDDVAFVFYHGFLIPDGLGVEMSQFTESGTMMFSIVPSGGVT